MKKYRTFSAAFKQQLVEQIESGAISGAQAAREHQLSSSLIDRWRHRYAEGRLVEKPSLQEKALERELERYKKKVAELVLENDLLKKLKASSRATRESNGSVVTIKNWDRSGGPVK